MGVSVKYDNADNKKPGWKFAEYELKGVPVRVTLGARDLENGMVEEVERLVKNGIPYESLEYYGLEYKYLAWYLQGKISYDEMFEQLNTSIHRFAKRQMTWFRKMERDGIEIHWLDGNLSMEEKVRKILELMKN